MKPRVQYIDLAHCVVGQSAKVMPLDHPREEINRTWVHTSPVLRFMLQSRGPVFETRNTVYWPAETDESPVPPRAAERMT
jgi:hypothetical protein